MSAVLQRQSALEQAYSRLKSTPLMSPNHEWLACMTASWCVGQSVLPDYMGLEPDQFEKLKDQALSMGFSQVASGPLVRSSYHAKKLWKNHQD